jgi:hypothetical protein
MLSEPYSETLTADRAENHREAVCARKLLPGRGNPGSRRRKRHLDLASWMPALLGALLVALPVAAQTDGSGTAKSSGEHPAQRTGSTETRKPHIVVDRPGLERLFKTHQKTQKTPAAEAQKAEAAPAYPVPPAQQPAHPATVTFQGGELHVQANNSSLSAIFEQISRETGLTVDGMSSDARLYGEYGPGPVAGIVSKLLEGSRYNYILVGVGSNGVPKKLMLTPVGATMNSGAMAASTGATPARPVAANPAPAMANPSAPVKPKTVQQIFDELRRLHKTQ